MRNRKFIIGIFTMAMTAVFSFASYAGQWQSDSNGWWWQNDDGSYPSNAWRWLDGNNDGIAECYYFDENGYMLSNTTVPGVGPSEYTVNENGAWVYFGNLQTCKTSTLSGESGTAKVTYHHDLDTLYDARQSWKNSLSHSGIETVQAVGYTKGVSNIVLQTYYHTREGNAKLYQEEEVFIYTSDDAPFISVHVKYKDLPYIFGYGNHSYQLDICTYIEDISDERTAILQYITDPYDYLACERDLKALGYFTIMGGVQFVNDPEVGNLLIHFIDDHQGGKYQIYI